MKLRIVQRDCLLHVSNKQNHNASDSLSNIIVKFDVIAFKLTLFKIQTAMQSNKSFKNNQKCSNELMDSSNGRLFGSMVDKRPDKNPAKCFPNEFSFLHH